MSRLSLVRLLTAAPLLFLPLVLACDPRSPDGSATSEMLGYTPSNVVLSPEMFEGVGDVVMDDADGCTIGAIAPGRLNCGSDLDSYQVSEGTGTEGESLRIVTLRSLRVTEGTVVEVSGDEPLVIVALDSIDIQGELHVQYGELGGAATSGSEGTGLGPGGGQSSAVTLQNGAGGTYCGRGGAAGDGTASAEPYGGIYLVPLQGGSSGGGRFSGAGGGALQLSAGASLRVSGVISAPGQGMDNVDAGGGSGGGILLEAQAVEITGIVAANGGGGASEDKRDGEDGQPGDVQAAGGVSPDDGAAGGAGSGGAVVDALDGAAPTAENRGGGSGGGGAGRIRINVLDGQFTGDQAILSPGTDTFCAVVGEVTPVSQE